LLKTEPHDSIHKDSVLLTLYAENEEKLKDAYNFAKEVMPIKLEQEILKEI
jgi:thymidine phosphorylase